MKKIAILLTVVVLLMLGLCCCSNTPAGSDAPGSTDTPGSADGKLAAPVVKMAGNSIYWNEVPNADYYEVFLNGKSIKVTLDTFYYYSFSVNGTYSFTVVARSLDPDHERSNPSQTVLTTVSRLELKEPDVMICENEVSWAAVPGATGYDVYVDNKLVEKPKFEVKDNVFYWRYQPTEKGNHTIEVCSCSNNADYESQSGRSEILYFNVTKLKSWTKNNMLDDWSIFGGVETHISGICLECSDYNKSGLVGYCLIESEKPFIHFDYCEIIQGDAEGQEAKIQLFVNGTTVYAVGSSDDHAMVSGDTSLSYDLSEYIGQVVQIKVESTSGNHACIERVFFGTNDRVSPYQEWTNSNYEEEWAFGGKVAIHNEGLCLEYEGAEASAQNMIRVTEQKPFFTIELRKFVRNGKQDEDPQLYVYINGVLMRALQSESDHATVSGDTPMKFTYDLRGYIGQSVEVRLVSRQGEHSCLPRIYMSSKGTHSLATRWEVPFIQEEWTYNGKVENHVEGVCLENEGNFASIENKVQITNEMTTLVISFRKFVRNDVQDIDPQIKVYVDGTLVKAQGTETDYVTVTGDQYIPFEFDLSAYAGQIVTIKVQNECGQHACFNLIYFK